MSIFSVNSDVPDVEALLSNVARAVRQWEGGEAPPLELSLLLGEAGKLSQQANRLKSQWNVNSSAIIQSTRPGLGPLIIRFQHAIRRLTWWFVEPIVMQIRSFQMNAALALGGLAQSQEDALNKLQEQAAEIEQLRQELAVLQARIADDGARNGSQ